MYGLRIAPKAWGIERGKQLNQMKINVKGKTYVFAQSHIDPSVWSSVRSSVASEGRALRRGASLPRERADRCTRHSLLSFLVRQHSATWSSTLATP